MFKTAFPHSRLNGLRKTTAIILPNKLLCSKCKVWKSNSRRKQKLFHDRMMLYWLWHGLSANAMWRISPCWGGDRLNICVRKGQQEPASISLFKKRREQLLPLKHPTPTFLPAATAAIVCDDQHLTSYLDLSNKNRTHPPTSWWLPAPHYLLE